MATFSTASEQVPLQPQHSTWRRSREGAGGTHQNPLREIHPTLDCYLGSTWVRTQVPSFCGCQWRERSSKVTHKASCEPSEGHPKRFCSTAISNLPWDHHPPGNQEVGCASEQVSACLPAHLVTPSQSIFFQIKKIDRCEFLFIGSLPWG